MVQPALEAARILEAAGIDATVVNCRFLKPIDAATFEWVRTKHHAVITVEEGTVVNGFGNDSGTLRLEGKVERFAIGGQELWLDEVCFTP